MLKDRIEEIIGSIGGPILELRNVVNSTEYKTSQDRHFLLGMASELEEVQDKLRYQYLEEDE